MIPDAPEWLQALILGVVQGLTEFIPVSSSAHLVLVPALAGWERHGLVFDVALHLGTLVALIAYYRRDLWGMACAVVARTPSQERSDNRRLILLLALASVPVAIAGLTLEGLVESVFNAPVTTASLLLITAVVLVGGERLHRRRRAVVVVHAPVDGAAAPVANDGSTEPGRERIGLASALTVGIVQCFALLPGLTRSGLTISAGIASGLSRPAATRFAFLLGLPAIAGAAIVQAPQVDGFGAMSPFALLIGMIAAAVSGYLAIALLVRLVSRAGIDRFAWYVVPLAIISLIVLG